MNYEKVALIGIGNIMFHDEGLGAYLVKYIELNYKPHPKLTIVEGSNLGFTLMTYYQEYDKIILVSSGSKEGEVGAISSENAQEIISNENTTRKTANEVELTMMIEICSFHEKMGEVQLITMTPKDIIEVKNGMTPEALAKMPDLVNATLKELENSGIVLEPNGADIGFDEIIEGFANPRVSDFTV